jgi:cell division protein FtsW (lipid II flippase)
MKQNFFNEYKVVIIGLISAVALALNELFIQGEASTKVLVYAAFLAALSFLAKNLRGQWATISGIVATALSTYITQEQSGTISWPQIILQAVIAFLAVVAPPAKSRGYEHTQTIQNAKAAGEVSFPSTASKL